MDVADPEALPHADDARCGQADHDDDDGVEVGVGQHLRAERADKADRGTDGQVDVAAGQDAQQHAAGHHQHVGVLQQQVRQVLRVEQAAAGQEREQGKHHHQGDDHGVFFHELRDIGLSHSCISLARYFLSDLRIAAMIFSCVASAAGICATICPSFMT